MRDEEVVEVEMVGGGEWRARLSGDILRLAKGCNVKRHETQEALQGEGGLRFRGERRRTNINYFLF